jgi:hypothetical protein
MSLTLLNFDIFFDLVPLLEIEDVVHLGKTCRVLKELSYDDQICGQVVKVG